MAKPKHVLFVCTNNVFRSVLSEHLFRQLAGDKFETSSAGIPCSSPDRSALGTVQDYLSEQGIDASTHSSTRLTRKLVDSADAIVTMANRIRDRVLEKFPDAADKTHLLLDFAKPKLEDTDIHDPATKSPDVVADTAELIAHALIGLRSYLLHGIRRK